MGFGRIETHMNKVANKVDVQSVHVNVKKICKKYVNNFTAENTKN